MKNNLIGQVGRCEKGFYGLILGYKKCSWKWTWVGINLEDGGSWSSRSPSIVGYRELVELMEGKVNEEVPQTLTGGGVSASCADDPE